MQGEIRRYELPKLQRAAVRLRAIARRRRDDVARARRARQVAVVRAAGARAVAGRRRCAAAQNRAPSRRTVVKLVTWNVNSLNVRLPRLLALARGEHARTSSACRKPSSRTRGSRTSRSRRRATRPTRSASARTTASRSSFAKASLHENVTMGLAGVRGPEAPDRRDGGRRAHRLRVRAEWPVVGSDKYAYKLAWCKALTRRCATRCATIRCSRSPAT